MELARFLVIAAFWGLCGWVLLVNCFAAVMHAKAIVSRGETLPRIFMLPLYVGFVLGGILDISFNWTIGIYIYREAPRELTFTSRCKRHKAGHGWQREKAYWWCEHLSKFDKGHC